MAALHIQVLLYPIPPKIIKLKMMSDKVHNCHQVKSLQCILQMFQAAHHPALINKDPSKIICFPISVPLALLFFHELKLRFMLKCAENWIDPVGECGDFSDGHEETLTADELSPFN